MDDKTIARLIRDVEQKDGATAAHIWRVALYAQAAAEASNLDREVVRRIMHGAVLHDIGKIELPSAILQKPGKLTPAEYAIVKQHTILGYERLQALGESDGLVLDIVRSHHERLDGSGYPDGLRGDEIPLAAQYFAVIDSFDAMTSIRSYRCASTIEGAKRAIERLNQEAGTRYGVQALKVFTDLFETGRINWILEHFNDETSLRELDVVPKIDDVNTTRIKRQSGQ